MNDQYYPILPLESLENAKNRVWENRAISDKHLLFTSMYKYLIEIQITSLKSFFHRRQSHIFTQT